MQVSKYNDEDDFNCGLESGDYRAKVKVSLYKVSKVKDACQGGITEPFKFDLKKQVKSAVEQLGAVSYCVKIELPSLNVDDFGED